MTETNPGNVLAGNTVRLGLVTCTIVLSMTLLFLLPALYNGFPLVYGDSASYLHGHTPSHSMGYYIFNRIFDMRVSPWRGVVLQSLIVSWTIFAIFLCFVRYSRLSKNVFIGRLFDSCDQSTMVRQLHNARHFHWVDDYRTCLTLLCPGRTPKAIKNNLGDADRCGTWISSRKPPCRAVDISGSRFVRRFSQVVIAAMDEGGNHRTALDSVPAIEVEFGGAARVRIAASTPPELARRGQGAVPMIPICSGLRAWIATGRTDMRRGMNAPGR
jgi:hypothetical protein